MQTCKCLFQRVMLLMAEIEVASSSHYLHGFSTIQTVFFCFAGYLNHQPYDLHRAIVGIGDVFL